MQKSHIFIIGLVLWATATYGRIVYSSDPVFSERFSHVGSTLTFIESIAGGGGGVSIYKDNSGKRYTIKASKDISHMKEEIISDALYASLDVPMPDFVVLDSLPPNFKNVFERYPEGPYRVAQFIEGRRPALDHLQKEVIAQIREFYVADALLSNRDIGAGFDRNIIIATDEKVYRIDNGGGLRYRSVSGRKGREEAWDSTLLPELNTLPTYNPEIYGRISQKEIQVAAQKIFRKAPTLLATLNKATKALDLSDADRLELNHLLIGRLQTLMVLTNPQDTYRASAYRYTSPFTAAGALIITQHQGEFKVLLGQRKSGREFSNNTWCPLGGGADQEKDMDLAEAASREIYEESGGLINIPDVQLRESISHDLVRPAHLYRQYIVSHIYIDPAEIMKKSTVSKKEGSDEYNQFQWIPLKDLINDETLRTGRIRENKLFPPFWDMLKTRAMIWNITQILKGSLKKKEHTQSAVQDVQRIQKVPLLSIMSFPQAFSTSTLREDSQLGKSILQKSLVVDQINKRQSPEARHPSHSYSSNADEAALYRYTASEAQLKVWLGDNYVPVINVRDPADQLRENSGRALARMGYFIKSPDEFFKHQLLQALLKERSFDPRWMVLYHGVDGEIGWLYDLFTELRQILRGQYSDNLQVLRVYDKIFEGMDTVVDFEAKYASSGKYSKNYQSLAVSTNFFLFGNPDIPSSCSVSYFFSPGKKGIVDIEKFLKVLEIQFGGLRLSKDKYVRLYEHAMGSSPEGNSRLYQIFIHPDYVNSLVYASEIGEKSWSINYSALREALKDHVSLFPNIQKGLTSVRSCTHGQESTISLMPSNALPKDFISVTKYDPAISERVFSGNDSLNTLQARLFLKPECQDMHLIQTFMYRRLSDQEKYDRFLMLLRQALIEDISFWLGQKNHMDPLTAHKARAKTHFRTRYEQIHGKLSYRENPAPEEKFLNLEGALAYLMKTENKDELEEFLGRYNVRDLCKMVSVSSAGSFNPLIFISLPWVRSSLRNIVESNPQKFIPQIEPLIGTDLGLPPQTLSSKDLNEIWDNLFNLIVPYISLEKILEISERPNCSELFYNYLFHKGDEHGIDKVGFLNHLFSILGHGDILEGMKIFRSKETSKKEKFYDLPIFRFYFIKYILRLPEEEKEKYFAAI